MRNHLEKSGEFQLEIFWQFWNWLKIFQPIWTDIICPDGPHRIGTIKQVFLVYAQIKFGCAKTTQVSLPLAEPYIWCSWQFLVHWGVGGIMEVFSVSSFESRKSNIDKVCKVQINWPGKWYLNNFYILHNLSMLAAVIILKLVLNEPTLWKFSFCKIVGVEISCLGINKEFYLLN